MFRGALTFILNHLPNASDRSIGWLAYLIWLIMLTGRSETYRSIKLNINLCFKSLPARERSKLIRQSLYENILTCLQLPAVWGHADPLKRFHCQQVLGQEVWQQARQNGHSTLFISPHIGNWELITHWFAKNNIPGIGLYRPTHLELLERSMVYGRTRFGQHLAPTTKQGIRTMLRELKNGGNCCLLPDQTLESEGAVMAPFFDIPVQTSTLLGKLTKRTQANIIFIYALRTSNSSYQIHLESGQELAQASQSIDDLEFASRLNKRLEQIIRQKPQQYLWLYKRFKKCAHIQYS